MRPPIAWFAGCFGAGLWVGLASFEPSATRWAAVLLGLGAGALFRRAPVAAAVALAAVAGVFWGAAVVRVRADTCAGRWSAFAPAARVATRAAWVRLLDPAPAAGSVVEGQVLGGACGGSLRLRWPEGRPARGGSSWVVAGPWRGAAPHGVLVVRRARRLDAAPRGRGALRDRVAAQSVALFGARAPLVDALVLGRRTQLDATARERYARAGLAHLLAISGLHVGFFAAWLTVLIRWLRLGPGASLVVGAAGVIGYVAMLGFPAPAARAGAMLLLARLAERRQRVVSPRGLIAVAALLVLLVDPWAVRSVGAWLSVAAVAAVIWGARAVAHDRLWLKLLVPATAATLATAPITAYAFGTVAPIGIALNIVAIPVAAVAVPGLMLALLASVIVPPFGALFAGGAGLGLAFLDLLAEFGARVPGGHVVQPPGWSAAALWAAVAGAAWWLWHAPRRPWLRAARLAAIGAATSWFLVVAALARSEPSGLAVYFLDVGQGDAAVLRTPGGRWIVIDGGPRFGSRDAGRSVVLPFLRRRGASALLAVIASHGDADHLGGLPSVVEAFPPTYVLEPGEPLGRPLYLEFLAAVEAAGARWHPARTGDRLEVDGVRIEVLSPDSAWLRETLDVNEHSLVLLVRYGNDRLLFAGDAGAPVEARLGGRVGHVRLLKVGHHGSRTATTAAWLDELRPEDAVISVGAKNRYGHPAPEVLARLAARGIAVRRTDRDGMITFITDGTRAHSDVDHY